MRVAQLLTETLNRVKSIKPQIKLIACFEFNRPKNNKLAKNVPMCVKKPLHEIPRHDKFRQPIFSFAISAEAINYYKSIL